MVDTISLLDKLTYFGLSASEAGVYLALMNNGWLTALQLSRKCPIKRTTLYRILESLLTKGIVEKKLDDKTTMYSAAAVDQFERLIQTKEEEVARLRMALPELQTFFDLSKETGNKEINVRFFRGMKGLQHMQLKSASNRNSEVLIFDSGQWYGALGQDFAEEVRRRIVQNNIQIREIYNGPATNTPTGNTEYLHNHYRYHTVNPETIKITQDIFVFGETIHFYGYNQQEMVGIEIQSQAYSQIMRQMFEVVWRLSK